MMVKFEQTLQGHVGIYRRVFQAKGAIGQGPKGTKERRVAGTE